MNTHRAAPTPFRMYEGTVVEHPAPPPREQKPLPYRYTTLWKGTCPNCGHEFDQEEAKCPTCRHPYLVVRQNAGPSEPGGFFLVAFQFTRMVGRQELRCSANDGFHDTVIGCPVCGGAVQGDYLCGIYTVPRRILYVPFVLLLTLGVVRATCGLAIILWPFVTRFFGWVYRSFTAICPRPIRRIFTCQVAYSFYETNEAHLL